MRQRALLGAALLVALAVGIAQLRPAGEAPPAPTEQVRTDRPLPGALPRTAELSAALAAEPLVAPFRTKHLDDDGQPLYVNRLVLASSPYLRQHAYNPVDWYPWGEAAMQAARDTGRPIFLSVGYATCHWCHVMEEESFENESIAELINSRYIAVKVDREERPDLDAVYMTAVRGFTGGQGGWPMTLWLTAEGEPFYGATYVPPEDGMRGQATGLRTMLTRLADMHADQPDRVAMTTASVRRSIRETLEAHPAPAELPDNAVESLIGTVELRYDQDRGGLDQAKKFPSHVPIRALLRTESADLAEHTLGAMAAGGIYDHLGGGFHRYSTDRDWRVPHFEKMLYDNALLAVAYTEAAQRSGDAGFERVARETLDMLLRDFELEHGGMASATDADSINPQGEREEGASFTWRPDELADVLPPADAKAFAEAYHITERGHLDGRSVLYLDEIADPDVHAGFAQSRAKLLAHRDRRPQPLRDDKVLAGQNGLAISAFAVAGRTFGERHYIDAAERTAEAIWERQVVEGRVRRVWTTAGAAHDGQLEDYAFLCAAMLDLFEATGERRWLDRALALDDSIVELFSDEETGSYFVTPRDGEKLLARERAGGDGAVPGGASVHALNLMRLAELTTADGYRDRALAIVQAQGDRLVRSPTAYGDLFLAAQWLQEHPREIVLIGEGEQAEALRTVLREEFLPFSVLVDVSETEARDLESLTSLVRDRVALGGQATVYVCQQGVCQQPVTDPDVLREQLEAK